MKVEIFVEGGGSVGSEQSRLRKAFKKFFEKASFKGHMPTIIACGGRDQAYGDFCNAVERFNAKNAKETDKALPVLLVDSEALVSATSKWEHLRQRDGWRRPEQVTEDQVYLMIVCMEAWFMADKQALSNYYKQDFNLNALPQHNNIEEIPKQDLEHKLDAAAKATKEGRYEKKHAFKILENINPQKVIDASPQAQQMVAFLKRMLK